MGVFEVYFCLWEDHLLEPTYKTNSMVLELIFATGPGRDRCPPSLALFFSDWLVPSTCRLRCNQMSSLQLVLASCCLHAWRTGRVPAVAGQPASTRIDARRAPRGWEEFRKIAILPGKMFGSRMQHVSHRIALFRISISNLRLPPFKRKIEKPTG